MTKFRLQYLGGPTALIEVAGVRLLTDPTFDPVGDHPVGTRVLVKTLDPIVTPQEIGSVDAVLLSHDQHPDNLDDLGRDFLATSRVVLSTPSAQERIGDKVQGLGAWESVEVNGLTVTAVPALHGPPGTEPVVGQVTGFVLASRGQPAIYVSGDNASLDHVRSIADRFTRIDIAVLFAGAARTALLDGAALTLTSAEAAEAAAILGARQVIPLHFEGWAHFTEGRDRLVAAFEAAGLRDRLNLLALGEWYEIDR
jgi:L-ascorbate metabolism protein UlaG (beta-lactamase superfamily)